MFYTPRELLQIVFMITYSFFSKGETIMLKTINVLFTALFLIQGVIAGRAFSEGTTASSQQGVVQAVPQQQETEMPAELKKSIMRKEEKGLDLARSAIEMADPYPNLKESVKAKAEEIQELTKNKTALQTIIQRTKVDRKSVV